MLYYCVYFDICVNLLGYITKYKTQELNLQKCVLSQF